MLIAQHKDHGKKPNQYMRRKIDLFSTREEYKIMIHHTYDDNYKGWGNTKFYTITEKQYNYYKYSLCHKYTLTDITNRLDGLRIFHFTKK